MISHFHSKWTTKAGERPHCTSMMISPQPATYTTIPSHSVCRNHPNLKSTPHLNWWEGRVRISINTGYESLGHIYAKTLLKFKIFLMYHFGNGLCLLSQNLKLNICLNHTTKNTEPTYASSQISFRLCEIGTGSTEILKRSLNSRARKLKPIAIFS